MRKYTLTDAARLQRAEAAQNIRNQSDAGSISTDAKAEAARANGRKGGRPRKSA